MFWTTKNLSGSWTGKELWRRRCGSRFVAVETGGAHVRGGLTEESLSLVVENWEDPSTKKSRKGSVSLFCLRSRVGRFETYRGRRRA